MVSLEVGASSEKAQVIKSICGLEERQGDLENMVFQVKAKMVGVEENAKKQREKITSIFDEVRRKIVLHEQELQARISESLEKEQSFMKSKINEIEFKLRQIKNLTDMKNTLQIESNIDILLKAKFRGQLID